MRYQRVGWGVVAAVALLVLASAAQAEDPLDKAMEQAAKDIRATLEDHDAEAVVSVDEFTSLSGTAGPGIANALISALSRQKVDRKDDARGRVGGTFRVAEDRTTREQVAVINVRVRNARTDQVLSRKDYQVSGVAALARLFGGSGEVRPREAGGVRPRKDTFSPGAGRPHVDGTRLLAAAGSPYVVTVLVADEPEGPFREVRPTEDDDGVRVAFRRDQFYRLRVTNGTGRMTAVMLTVDGLNMFAYSKEKGRDSSTLRYVLLDPKMTATVAGWFRTHKVSEAFQFVSVRESAVGELKSTSGVGTLTLSFAPATEVTAKAGAASDRSPDEPAGRLTSTGRGPLVRAEYERGGPVRTDEVAAVLSLRYSRPIETFAEVQARKYGAGGRIPADAGAASGVVKLPLGGGSISSGTAEMIGR